MRERAFSCVQDGIHKLALLPLGSLAVIVRTRDGKTIAGRGTRDPPGDVMTLCEFG